MRSEGVDCERNSAIRGAAENAAFSGTSRRAWLYWLAVVVASEEKLQLRKGNMFKGAKRKVGGRNSTIRILRTHYRYLRIGGSAGTGRTGRFQPLINLGIGGSAGTGRNGRAGSYGREYIQARYFSDKPTAGTGRTGRFRPSEKSRDRRFGWVFQKVENFKNLKISKN